MLKEASAPSETPLTLVTSIRLGSLNIPLVALRLALTLPALPVFCILNAFIAMDPPMSQEMGIPPKGFATKVALVWLLPSVDFVMLKEAAALAEGLPTLITLVGLLPSVSSLVLDEV